MKPMSYTLLLILTRPEFEIVDLEFYLEKSRDILVTTHASGKGMALVSAHKRPRSFPPTSVLDRFRQKRL